MNVLTMTVLIKMSFTEYGAGSKAAKYGTHIKMLHSNEHRNR